MRRRPPPRRGTGASQPCFAPNVEPPATATRPPRVTFSGTSYRDISLGSDTTSKEVHDEPALGIETIVVTSSLDMAPFDGRRVLVAPSLGESAIEENFDFRLVPEPSVDVLEEPSFTARDDHENRGCARAHAGRPLVHGERRSFRVT